MLIGSLLFVAGGIWFVINPATFQLLRFHQATNSIIEIRALGCIAVVFFGAAAVFLAQKVFDAKPGLIIDDLGIIDNSTKVAGGRVLWEEILRITEYEYSGQRFVVIVLKDPERYIDRAKGLLKCNIMRMNLNKCGSPAAISANSLKITYADLRDLITEKLDEYHNLN